MPDYLEDILFLLLITTFTLSFANYGNYPHHPDPRLTPGTTCSQPTEFRYRERIAYCERDVDTERKNEIIAVYEEVYNFSITPNQRNKYKIDHYIPLCMGGSNEDSNLWPQQEKIYLITDPLESVLCNKIAENRISQDDAIEMIKMGKNNLDMVPNLLKQAKEL
jgi:hypothetical protein